MLLDTEKAEDITNAPVVVLRPFVFQKADNQRTLTFDYKANRRVLKRTILLCLE